MNGRLISEDAIDAAFKYLNEASQEIAMARGNVIRAEYQVKATKAKLFLDAPGGTVDSKKAWAESHKLTLEAVEKYALAEETWERMKDQRNRAELIIEAWRTEQASLRTEARIQR